MLPVAPPSALAICLIFFQQNRTVNPGQTETVEFELRQRELSTWDVAAHGWKLARGVFKIEVAAAKKMLPKTVLEIRCC